MPDKNILLLARVDRTTNDVAKFNLLRVAVQWLQ